MRWLRTTSSVTVNSVSGARLWVPNILSPRVHGHGVGPWPWTGDVCDGCPPRSGRDLPGNGTARRLREDCPPRSATLARTPCTEAGHPATGRQGAVLMSLRPLIRCGAPEPYPSGDRARGSRCPGLRDDSEFPAFVSAQASPPYDVEHALARVDPAPGPRLEQLTARARGLLAEPAGAAAHFAASLAGSAGETWPFERAQLQLDHGEWLRRQRRINDAKPVLAAAMETLHRLGAAPWTRRAESELRACGVAAQTRRPSPARLTGSPRSSARSSSSQARA